MQFMLHAFMHFAYKHLMSYASCCVTDLPLLLHSSWLVIFTFYF